MPSRRSSGSLVGSMISCLFLKSILVRFSPQRTWITVTKELDVQQTMSNFKAEGFQVNGLGGIILFCIVGESHGDVCTF